jgi:hypothetical protein
MRTRCRSFPSPLLRLLLTSSCLRVRWGQSCPRPTSSLCGGMNPVLYTPPHTPLDSINCQRTPPDSSGLQFVTRMSPTGVRWSPAESSNSDGVHWTPADSSRLQWTPADSSRLQWTPVDSSGLGQTPLYFLLRNSRYTLNI